MTRDDIIRMGKKAWALELIPESDVTKLERFAALVAAAEREAIFSVGKRHYDHEGAAAAHHAGRFQDAYQWHSTRQGALRDFLDDIRARGTE